MLIRREGPGDQTAIHAIHLAAFGQSATAGTVEARLVDELRECDGWIGALSLVAVEGDEITGHVVCTRATVGPDNQPLLGLGPLGVRPDRHGTGVGKALMHAVEGKSGGFLWGTQEIRNGFVAGSW